MQPIHLMHLIRFAALILCACCATASCRNEESQIVTLRDWDFRTGFQRVWTGGADPSGWRRITTPLNLSASQPELADYRGWITLRATIPEDLSAQLRSGRPLALNAGRTLDVSRFYLNGSQVGELGSDSPYAPGAMRPFLRDLPLADVRNNSPNVITIALYTNGKFPLQLMDPIQLGPSDAVYEAQRASEVIAFSLLTIYFFSGSYHLLLFARRPRDRYNFYFGLGAVLLSVYWFVANTTTRDLLFRDAVELHRRVEHILLFLLPALFAAFTTEFCGQRLTRAVIAYAAFCALTAALAAFAPLPLMRLARDLWFASALLIIAYMIYYMIRSIRGGDQEAWYLIVGVIALAASVAHDMAVSLDYIHTAKISNYTFVLFVGGLAGLMAARFMRVTNEVEALNRDLEDRVTQRTHELAETLSQVRALKDQQDGDYFLTSLLLRPLGGDYSRSETCSIDMLTEQKKSFRFRERTAEIGGDLSIADSIRLGERDYTVVLNGDAMGKSMQGAGGALALGAVFRSIVTRTQIAPEARNATPENWLELTWRELSAVFESFDGSMLVSATLALVDDADGACYILNAEHPWPALYRAGRAEFLVGEASLHKIGVKQDGRPPILKLRLEPGDAVLFGSDGRDDLQIGLDDEGRRRLNEDERAFLKRVEEGRGQLLEIRAALAAAGELTDDLSLVRLGYRERESSNARATIDDSPGSRDRDPDPNDTARQSRELRGFLKRREIHSALALARIILARADGDDEALYLCSAALKLAGLRAEAIDVGERLAERNARHINNLLNLADLHRLQGETRRAREYLQKARTLDPVNPAVERLGEMLANGTQ